MPTPKRISLLLAATIVTSLLALVAGTLSRGQTTPSANPRISVLRRKDQLKTRPRPEEIAAFQNGKRDRTFKTREFKDMPLAIRQVRNLQSDTWYDELEIEVKNVSNKPIYFILAYLGFPDVPVPADGMYGIALEFGARRNITFRKDADPKDPHLNPGEKFTFTIPEKMREGLRDQHERSPELMKKLELNFSVISFGDGTGFVAERLRDHRRKYSHSGGKKSHHSARSGKTASMEPPSQNGCGTCSRYAPDEEPSVICYSGGPCDSNVATTSPDRPCTLIRPRYFDCGELQCHHDEIYESPSCPGYSATPTPSPTPTPTQSPSPAPTCNPNTKPNNQTCECRPVANGGVDWFCDCPDGSVGADHLQIQVNGGCPPGTYNDLECCRCLEQNHTCGTGCQWSAAYCQCVDFVGQPCSSATPAPSATLQSGGAGGGGGGGGQTRQYENCTEYYWVYYEYWGGSWHEMGSWYAGCW